MTNETLTKTIETNMASIKPAMEKATNEAVAQARVGYEQMNEKTREMMENSMKSMTEMSEFAKGNMEAFMASAKAAAAAAEVISNNLAAASKKSMEDVQVAMKAMTASKSPNEFIQMQSDFAKVQFDAAVANMSNMSETILKLTGEVTQPLSSRLAVAADTMKTAVKSK